MHRTISGPGRYAFRSIDVWFAIARLLGM